jgi:pyrroloquinoline quinone biosynthesis protein B
VQLNHFHSSCCRYASILIVLLIAGCNVSTIETPDTHGDQYLIVLGIAQDAGFPQIGCDKECCKPLWRQATPGAFVVSLGLVDHVSQKKWLFECTPDIRPQLHLFNEQAGFDGAAPDGIFLTHAHMGHYSGLMHFGREAMGAGGIPVYVMPRFETFLRTNGPWDQLVALNNIAIHGIKADSAVVLSNGLRVTPLLVPHRDEYSETVGFRIVGANQSVLFIPDIDKWEHWSRQLRDEIALVDIALLDATFYADGELEGRAMSEVPHPFVVETMEHLKDLSPEEKSKVHFIHFNHTNPLLRSDSVRSVVKAAGFNLAEQGQLFDL